ncbi:MAG TPA: carboxylesterase/lipase family protein [Candidatus Saccharimonadales bacterium]|nr:carboxylesterase/lipase family protein [Candidatus Saccharimonadales bacterium]
MKRSFLTFFALLTVVSTALGMANDPIRVEQGQLSGTTGKDPSVHVYRGIPFAAPPVGELRWKPPQPPAAWQGIREAKEFGSACWQTQYPSGSIYQAKLPPLSEDCLSLNVWTTAKSAKDHLPVMVWIHGGGFTRGSGSNSTYDGENLARKGVVLVTINYRLGIFGFFAHPALTAESAHHASGNYALLDQIAALEWVKKNIGAFGGNPDRVTIFGESAGSWAVNALMASPLAKGLFHRVIGESGGLFSPMTSLATAEKTGEHIAASLNATQDTLKTLRSTPAEELLKASNTPTASAIVDGWVLPQDVQTIFAQGKQNDVPLLVGNNADEGTTLAPQGASLTSAMFSGGVQQRYGSQADQFFKVYPAGSDAEAIASFYSAYRDQVFGWEMRAWTRLAAKTGHQPVYKYYFSHRPPGPQSARLRAFHACELPYVFGNFIWQFPWEEADHKLAETVSTYWVNFAKTGNPNGNGLVKWPGYDPATDQSLEFGDPIGVRSQINKAGLDFFDSYYQALAAPPPVSAGGGTPAKK